MIRLNLSNRPEWLNLLPGLRVLVAPLTTALMVSARADPMIDGLTETSSQEDMALAMAKAVARRAVLDWELSTLGHPLADLAYQCMQWRLPHASGMRGLGGLDRNGLGLPSEAEYVAAYCQRRGLPGIGNWEFYLAFSFFRLAAILQGVVRRAHDGNASNPTRAREMAKAIPILAAMANDLF